MIELNENNTKFVLMFMVAHSNIEIEEAIKKHQQLLMMKPKKNQIEKTNSDVNVHNFDYSDLKTRLKKHIPMLSDNQFNHAVKMCKQNHEKINSETELMQCIIDHL